MSDQQAMRDLLDKQAITEVIYNYSRACDRLDRELLESVYWPDGTDDHGIFKGTAPEYFEWVMGLLGAWRSSHHDNTNILIRLEGDVAYGECHWVGYYSFEVDGVLHDQLAAGRYLDRFEKRGGEWRIKHRTSVSEWNRLEPAQGDWRAKRGPEMPPSRRDRTDPSYDLENIAIISAE